MKKKTKKRECIIRGNKVNFYGELAAQIRQAAKLQGISEQQWFNQCLMSAIKQYRLDLRSGKQPKSEVNFDKKRLK